MAAEVTPKRQGVPVPCLAPKHRVPVPGRGVPITSGCKNQQRLWLKETNDLGSPRQFLLKGLHTDILDSLALSSSAGAAA